MQDHDSHDDADCAGPVVDFHAHIATSAVEPLVAAHPGRLAEMRAALELQGEASAEHNRRAMLPACMPKMTDLATRIADMDAMGVDVQILSPSPGQYYYWAEPDLARQIVALHNEHIAESVARHPDRLVGLASVALQHPDLAASQLEHAMHSLGLRGAEISTAAGGREFSDPAYEPFWAKAEELGAVLFIHPLGTSLGARLNRYYLSNIIGQPLETTVALSHLIFSGVLDRRPGLKIVAAHGGGYLPAYSSRSDHAWHARPDSHSMKEPLSAYLRRIHYDSLVYSPDALRALADQVGADRLVLGTDYPFDMGSYNVHELLTATPGLSRGERRSIRGALALTLLGLKAEDFTIRRSGGRETGRLIFPSTGNYTGASRPPNPGRSDTKEKT